MSISIQALRDCRWKTCRAGAWLRAQPQIRSLRRSPHAFSKTKTKIRRRRRDLKWAGKFWCFKMEKFKYYKSVFSLSLSIFFSLSLSLSHTNKHTQTRTHVYTQNKNDRHTFLPCRSKLLVHCVFQVLCGTLLIKLHKKNMRWRKGKGKHKRRYTRERKRNETKWKEKKRKEKKRRERRYAVVRKSKSKFIIIITDKR